MKSAEEAIDDAKKAMNEGGVARLRSATENLERTLHKIAEDALQETQAAGGAEQAGRWCRRGSRSELRARSGGGAPGRKPGDVIDAEYVDVDENKRPN